MIRLFDIPDTSGIPQFDNVLHDPIVDKFTERFCTYVGAEYGCATNSATNAIFLLGLYGSSKAPAYTVPSMIPPVVPNALTCAKAKFEFVDDPNWVGGEYLLLDGDYRIWDSAQQVDKGQCSKMGPRDITIFSFYPTKPVGSVDGGMIVSNDLDLIKFLRIDVMNGMDYSENSWDRRHKMPGWKMYMNSIQAFVANKSLDTLDERKRILAKIRSQYNHEFGLQNTSDHLYRIEVADNVTFLKAMQNEGIICGIHYVPCHTTKFFALAVKNGLDRSIEIGKRTVSIPFHSSLSEKDIITVIKCVKKHRSVSSPTPRESSAR